MSKVAVCLVAVALAAVVPASGYAGFIEYGEIETDGTSSTIDQWYFTVNSDDTIGIAVNGLELKAGWDMDPEINLYGDDGSLDMGDFIANDDDSGPGLDAYLELALTTGGYVLVVGDYDCAPGQFGPIQTDSISDDGWTYEIIVSGDATPVRVLEGNLNETFTERLIPEPATMSLVGVGLLALARRRRRTN